MERLPPTEKLIRAFPIVPARAKSTVQAMPDRHSERAQTPTPQGVRHSLTDPQFARPALVCRLQRVHAHKHFYPLTITNYSSRNLLACENSQSSSVSMCPVQTLGRAAQTPTPQSSAPKTCSQQSEDYDHRCYYIGLNPGETVSSQWHARKVGVSWKKVDD
jgi:hypothetical protein